MKAILASSLLVVALQSVPGAVIATTDQSESLTTADLLAQVQDPAVAESTVDKAAAPAAASGATAATGFPPDQLEQLVAPIALYPDALLAQILMAATYPLEIVEADRFMSQNPELKDTALDEALKDKDWDPSVKSLTKLPDVLNNMSENLDWTQDLGDAVLEQQAEVMETVQKMRTLAYETGNLKTSEQQVVTEQPDKIIVIESAEPEVVYVPTYSSTVVYGSSWGYPSYYYPPMYPYYPPGYGLISFGVGMAIGGAIWGDCNWGGNDINIDIDRYNEFNRNTNIDADRNNINRGEGGGRGGDKAGWNHDSSHRKGVNYKNPQTAQKFGASAGSDRVTRDQARGRAPTSTSGGAGGRQSAGTPQARDRSGTSSNARTPQTDRSGASDVNRSAAQANRSGDYQSNRSTSQSSRDRSNSAYSGSRSPSADRNYSSRGASSRGATSYGGSRGGTSRGGGRRR
jgi:hypothetical protein